ncbi:IclR family transcriptional regulator [Amycolatopsis rubida]|uniref:IclR family transcriptional regulator n=1 Tax=Amycolatopsis rubida TaxID=112413 RepID=A0A1I5ZAH1_9PSEU|nr:MULTISPECIES: IclR family transcriptional regulator [Amycolatopsis]MYW90794.1 helix-turn-helix domain-containing protein [Amycolatopsis rubida]NEC55777.1 IclR family transcriptional regulator [Amycolatopsis rubida]OAP26152.1 Transcriptional regulator KdgR [Amycolatopsis sp. M39]SFQ53496.1 transcriptional regulator, IclR family [Amycolatopsis rubida]
MAVPAAYPVEAIDNAARILLMLVDNPSLRVADVSAELGVARSTAHRMLTTLQARDLLRQDAQTKSYGPGPALARLGIAVIGAGALRDEARLLLEKLVDDTSETAHLLVLEGTETVFVEGVESRQVIRAGLRTGQRGPAHASAAGKALLAELSREELRRRYPGARLRGGTERAVSTRRALEAELEKVRETGYATNMEESEWDLCAVAATVRNRQGVACGALSVSGPARRAGAKLALLSAAVVAAATELGARLG